MTGVDLLVAIKDGVSLDDGLKVSKTWIPLENMKESHPVDVAEFAVANVVDKMPSFRWWVYHISKKRDTIIASVIVQVKKSTYKYSIEVPTSVEHAKCWTRRIAITFG